MKIDVSNHSRLPVGMKVDLTNNGSEIIRVCDSKRTEIALEIERAKVIFHMEQIEIDGFAKSTRPAFGDYDHVRIFIEIRG
jgi:hypothetical protein